MVDWEDDGVGEWEDGDMWVVERYGGNEGREVGCGRV